MSPIGFFFLWNTNLITPYQHFSSSTFNRYVLNFCDIIELVCSGVWYIFISTIISKTQQFFFLAFFQYVDLCVYFEFYILPIVVVFVVAIYVNSFFIKIGIGRPIIWNKNSLHQCTWWPIPNLSIFPIITISIQSNWLFPNLIKSLWCVDFSFAGGIYLVVFYLKQKKHSFCINNFWKQFRSVYKKSFSVCSMGTPVCTKCWNCFQISKTFIYIIGTCSFIYLHIFFVFKILIKRSEMVPIKVTKGSL